MSTAAILRRLSVRVAAVSQTLDELVASLLPDDTCGGCGEPVDLEVPYYQHKNGGPPYHAMCWDDLPWGSRAVGL